MGLGGSDLWVIVTETVVRVLKETQAHFLTQDTRPRKKREKSLDNAFKERNLPHYWNVAQWRSWALANQVKTSLLRWVREFAVVRLAWELDWTVFPILNRTGVKTAALDSTALVPSGSMALGKLFHLTPQHLHPWNMGKCSDDEN